MTRSGSWKELNVAAGSHGSEETAVKLRVPRLLGVKKQVKIVSAIRERIRSRIADRLGIGEDETQEPPPPVSTPPPNTPPPPRTATLSQNSPGEGQVPSGGKGEATVTSTTVKGTFEPTSPTRGTTTANTGATTTTSPTSAPPDPGTSSASVSDASTTDKPVTSNTDRPSTPTDSGITLTLPTASSTRLESTSSPSSTPLANSTPEPPRRPIAGIIAGVVLGTLALIFVIAFIVWRRRRAARAQARGLSFENISYPFTTGNTSFSSVSMSYHPPISPPSRAYMGVAGDNAPQMRQGSIDASSISSSTMSSIGVVVTASRRDVLSNESFTEVESVDSFSGALQGGATSRWSSTVDTHRELPTLTAPMSVDSHAGMSQISDPLWDMPPVPGAPHSSGAVVGSRWSSTMENGQSSSPPATASEESGALASAGDRLRSSPPNAVANRSRWSSTVDTHGTSLYPASTSDENSGPSPEVHQDPFSDDSRVSKEIVRGTSGSSHEVGGSNGTFGR
ncbi:hypothetical protein PM082_003654 [Marasmius tenuissimus]|nr:hypothetical protein PM082_003654 [Marasmius tenuissimus]